jgi:hypothetical protein
MMRQNLRATLFAESCKKVIFRARYSEALKAQDVARQIFGIQVRFILDNEKILSGDASTLTTINEKYGEYYWVNDTYKIYYKKIKIFCLKHNVDYRSMIRFCLCHEVGHGKDERLFEEIGFFPHTIRMPSKGAIKIETKAYSDPDIRKFYHRFIGGIFDFSVNKELLKYEMKNPFEKSAFSDKETGKIFKPKFDTKELGVLDSLLNLPLNLDTYEHGGLEEGEKKVLKEAQPKVVVNKWEKALSTLRSIDFFDPNSKVRVIIELLEEILGIQTYLTITELENLLSDYQIKYRRLPKFWSKESYEVLRIRQG